MRLQGKVALVTGASRGIGQAIALELGRQGAVVIGTATTPNGAERIAETLKANGVEGAGLVLAGQAAAQKAPVRVLLCDAAGDIAVVGKELPKLKPKDVTTQQMLQGLIKSGVKVEVCALYLPNSGHQASDLIAGVTAANPADVAAHLLKPEVKTLGF